MSVEASATIPTPSAVNRVVRDGSRDGQQDQASRRACLVCARPCGATQAAYCSAACRQRAYRARHSAPRSADLPATLRVRLQRAGRLKEQTLYACPECQERFLGDQRCPDCHRFCRVVGLGGACPHCDEPVSLEELLGLEESRA